MSKTLTQAQAKAVYSTMRNLASAGGLAPRFEFDNGVRVTLRTNGALWIGAADVLTVHDTKERHASASAFATAYGLDMKDAAPLTTNEAILEAVATANAHLNDACVPTLRELEQAVTAGAPQVLDFLPNGQRQGDYAMGWRDAMDRVYGRMQAAILAQRAINKAEQAEAA